MKAIKIMPAVGGYLLGVEFVLYSNQRINNMPNVKKRISLLPFKPCASCGDLRFGKCLHLSVRVTCLWCAVSSGRAGELSRGPRV